VDRINPVDGHGRWMDGWLDGWGALGPCRWCGGFRGRDWMFGRTCLNDQMAALAVAETAACWLEK